MISKGSKIPTVQKLKKSWQVATANARRNSSRRPMCAREASVFRDGRADVGAHDHRHRVRERKRIVRSGDHRHDHRGRHRRALHQGRPQDPNDEPHERVGRRGKEVPEDVLSQHLEAGAQPVHAHQEDEEQEQHGGQSHHRLEVVRAGRARLRSRRLERNLHLRLRSLTETDVCLASGLTNLHLLLRLHDTPPLRLREQPLTQRSPRVNRTAPRSAKISYRERKSSTAAAT